MRFLTLYWWEWVAYLFGFSSITINGLWLLTTFTKKQTQSGESLLIGTLPHLKSAADLTQIPQVERQGKRTVWISSLTLMIGLVTGTVIGYLSRDHQLVSSQYTYTDVEVVSKISNVEFKIWPDRMKQQHITLCSASIGWYVGEVLSDFTFEQKQGCKRVISYHEKIKGELNAAISNGR